MLAAGLSETDASRVIADKVLAIAMVDLTRNNRTQAVSGEILFHGLPLRITDHAAERMVERWQPRNQKLQKPLRTLKRLLKHTRVETLDERIRTQRLLKNQQHAEYLRHQSEHWRFITVRENGYRVLVTIERPVED